MRKLKSLRVKLPTFVTNEEKEIRGIRNDAIPTPIAVAAPTLIATVTRIVIRIVAVTARKEIRKIR